MSARIELKKLMKEYNLTTKDVAKMLHVTQRTVQYWLKNERPISEQVLELLNLKLEKIEKL